MSTTAKSLCKVLAGAWRRRPPPLDCSAEELAGLTPVLTGSGLAPLVWRRLRLCQTWVACAAELRRACRFHGLQNALTEHKIRQAFTLLRAAGVEPLAIKGLSSARFYARRDMRPYGDIDLVVRPSEMSAARSALEEMDGLRNWVDLHSRDGPEGYYLGEVFERSELFTLGGVPVRVPRPEDHLRVACLHLLKHGAWRPLWMCDVAAAVESRPAGFDWGVCLSGSREVAGRVGCAVRLAHLLLGADLSDTPFARAREGPPVWLVRAVLAQWERPFAQDHEAPELMSAALRRPAKLVKALRRRWPDPVKATLRFGGSFDESPRLVYQLGDYVLSGAAFVARLLRENFKTKKIDTETQRHRDEYRI